MDTDNRTLMQENLTDTSKLTDLVKPICGLRLKPSGMKKALLFALPVLAIVSLIAVGQSSPPSIQPVTLSADPLYALSLIHI